MQTDVVIRSFDPIDLRSCDKTDLTDALNHKRPVPLLPIFGQRDSSLRAFQSPLKPFVVERFQKIIESANLKSTQCITVISRHEDNAGCVASEPLDDIEAV